MPENSKSLRFHRGVGLIATVLLVHLLFGAAAVAVGGRFESGVTSIERYLINFLSGSEEHVSFSGAIGDFAYDYCFSECADCTVRCYAPSNLKLVCGGSCSLDTSSGLKVASERQQFKYVLKNGLLVEDSTFTCYNRSVGDCGFTIQLDENHTMSYNIPESMKSTSPS